MSKAYFLIVSVLVWFNICSSAKCDAWSVSTNEINCVTSVFMRYCHKWAAVQQRNDNEAAMVSLNIGYPCFNFDMTNACLAGRVVDVMYFLTQIGLVLSPRPNVTRELWKIRTWQRHVTDIHTQRILCTTEQENKHITTVFWMHVYVLYFSIHIPTMSVFALVLPFYLILFLFRLVVVMDLSRLCDSGRGKNPQKKQH